MGDWFTPSEETVEFLPVRPESPAEQTIELVLFSVARDRALHHWMDGQTPTEPLWPVVDQDLQ